MVYYIIIGYLAVLLTGIAQIFLKKGSAQKKSLLSIYLNKFSIVGYFVMFVVTLLNLYIYKDLDIKYGVVFLPFTFIIVSILSYYILKEKFTRNQIVGTVVIVIGVIVFNV